MEKRIVVISNGGKEEGSPVAESLKASGLKFETIRVGRGEPLPKTLEDISALLILGGPITINSITQNQFPLQPRWSRGDDVSYVTQFCVVRYEQDTAPFSEGAFQRLDSTGSEASIEGEASRAKTTAYRRCGTPREQAWMEGATRAPFIGPAVVRTSFV